MMGWSSAGLQKWCLLLTHPRTQLEALLRAHPTPGLQEPLQLPEIRYIMAFYKVWLCDLPQKLRATNYSILLAYS